MWESKRVPSIAEGRRARLAVLGREELRDREGVTRRGGEDSKEFAGVRSLEESLVERVAHNVVLCPPPGLRVVVDEHDGRS